MAIQMRSLLLGAFSFFLFVTTAFAADDLILKPIQVAPHTYFVQGLAEMGNSKNQNIISNVKFDKELEFKDNFARKFAVN